MAESKLNSNIHCLICFEVNLDEQWSKELEYIKAHFCGQVSSFQEINVCSVHPDSVVYACGNIGEMLRRTAASLVRNRIKIIKELSFNYENERNLAIVSIGQVPLNIGGIGVYFRNLFEPDFAVDYFAQLEEAHQFQSLTESNKSGSSYRKGIYLSRIEQEGDAVKFNLLRCSTNLDGPTDAFKSIDDVIVNKVNEMAQLFFEQPAVLNHVLAQIYRNSTVTTGDITKEKKARIQSHSDKTKDMPRNGLIAFCTFYSKELYAAKKSKDKLYDWVFKNESVLTRLRFRLKKSLLVNPELSHLKRDVTVTLYPNSVFLIPLSTNRWYTHEIVPPILPVDKIPTRLGYVIRCSKTVAIHKDGNTYIQEERIPPGNEYDYVRMEKPTEEDVVRLKDLYREENLTDKVVDYGKIYYSLNEGDYVKPLM